MRVVALRRETGHVSFMNTPKRQGLIVALMAGAALLSGCGKKEQAAIPSAPEVATKPAAAPVTPPTAMVPTGDSLVVAKNATPNAPIAPASTVPPAVTPASVAASASALASSLAPTFKLADIKIPDFQQASVSDISSVAVQALAGLKQTLTAAAPTSAPAASAAAKVEEVKTAVLGGQATVALEKLAQITDVVKGIPGGEAVLNTTKQLVSAWALKQGFDVSKISGLLGALQKGDYAGLASQAAGLFAKGGVSGEQKGLLDGVLKNFGIDPNNAAGAVNAVKGLFGK